MAQEKVYRIKVEGTEQVINNIEELETSVKQLEDKLKTTQIGTTEFKQLQNEVKKAKSVLKDFELQVEGLDKEQRATALVDSFNGLTGAVGAVSSAFLAFGVESEAIGEAEKKLLGVIGVVSGLRDASNGLVAVQKLMGNSSVKLGESLKTAFKGGVTGAQALKGAIIATGIGALIVAVGLLIENWEAFTKVLGFGASEAEKNLEIAQKQTEEAEAQLEATNNSTELLKQQGMSDKEILQLKIKQTDEIIKSLEAQLVAQEEIKKQQIASAQRNKDILSGIIRFITAPLEILLRSIDLVGKALGQDFGLAEGLVKSVNSIADLAFSPEDAKKKGDETIKETEKKLLQLKNSRAGYQNQIAQQDKANADKAKADAKKASDEAKAERDKQHAVELAQAKALAEAKRKLAESQAKDARTLLDTQYQNELAVLKEARDAELAQENLTAQAKLDIQAKYETDSLTAQSEYNKNVEALNKELEATRLENEKAVLEKERALKDAQLASLPEGFDKQRALVQENYARQIADAGANAELVKALEIQLQNELTAINKEQEEKRLADKKEVIDASYALANDGLQAVMDLTQAFAKKDEASQKKAFELAKKLQIAQTILSTIQGSQNAFTTAQKSPLTAVFPAYPFIQAGLALAFGLAKVKQIQSTQFGSTTTSGGGGSTGGGGSAGVGGTSSASLGAPNTTLPSQQQGGSTTQSGTQQGGGAPVVKTYVLAGDVSSAQQAEAKINQRRTL